MSQPTSSNEPLIAREILTRGVEFLQKKGVDNAQLDMSLILADVMGTDRLGVYTDLDRPLLAHEVKLARELLQRRARREPLAYILGHRDFYGITLKVTQGVLVPRPETEMVVDLAIEWIAKRYPNAVAKSGSSKESEQNQSNIATDPPVLVADIGCGSGAIGLALAKECPGVSLIATDISEHAIAQTCENSRALALEDRVQTRLGDLLSVLDRKVDLICSNPPYIREKDSSTLMPEVGDYEPSEALYSGPEGLDCARRLIADAPSKLNPGGALIMEFGYDQGEAILKLAREQSAFVDCKIHKDLNNHDRVLTTYLAES